MPDDVKYYHWNLKDIPGFVAMIQKHGTELRMEVHPHREDKLRLVPIAEEKDDDESQWFNYGQVCPPICP